MEYRYRVVGYFQTIVGIDNLNVVLVLNEYTMNEKSYTCWMGYLNINKDLGDKLNKLKFFDKYKATGYVTTLQNLTTELNIITPEGTSWIKIHIDPLQDNTTISLCASRNIMLDKCIVINDIIKLHELTS